MKLLKLLPGLFMVVLLSNCNKSSNELDFSAQLKKDVATIDTYLASHGINAVADSSGVRYVIHAQGTGIKPVATGKISAKYSATTLGSTQIFDKTDGAVFNLPTIIAGWQYAMPKINKGSTFTLYIPSGLGFGSAGVGGVAPNSNLVFDGQLFDDDAQLVADKAAIDHYLDSLQVDYLKDTTGIRWVYTGAPGTGTKASSNSYVVVTYKGTIFKTNTVFDQQSSQVSFQLSSLIEGWQDAFKIIPSGSTFTLYIPSGLAYGPAAKEYAGGSIHANSILVFDIHYITNN